VSPEASAGGELERLRLENETLSSVASVVSSGPDLAHILDRVVDLLTKATDCHACFIYLPAGDRLELRAASPVYTHLVGRIGFDIEDGLAGWTMSHGEPAFIREGAIEDPRTVYVPELEEERFQSMVAVPILARAGESIGAIVLHTVAPREFDEGILNILARTASLVSGAIENARLYEEAQERVSSLTQLSALGREVAAVADRASLVNLAADGIRRLIEADVCRLYEVDDSEPGLRLVASSPAGAAPTAGEIALAVELVETTGPARGGLVDELSAVFGLRSPSTAADAVSLMASGRRLGALLVLSERPWRPTAPELLRAAAQQVALAIQRTELIERLTEENLARDLFDALSGTHLELATEKTAAAGIDLRRPHVILEARPASAETPGWSLQAETVEKTIKRVLPEALCDVTPTSLRALVPVVADGIGPVRPIIDALRRAATLDGISIGLSEGRHGLEGLAGALREASDAARIAALLDGEQRMLPYRDTGAYRYLIDLIDSGGPEDHLHSAIEVLADYDRERNAQLLKTLDEYLGQGRSLASTARALIIHVNTLRQRLERIEELTGLSLEDEDLLALQLAVKLGRVRESRGRA
jgi:GAF domain-containing protein